MNSDIARERENEIRQIDFLAARKFQQQVERTLEAVHVDQKGGLAFARSASVVVSNASSRAIPALLSTGLPTPRAIEIGPFSRHRKRGVEFAAPSTGLKSSM